MSGKETSGYSDFIPEYVKVVRCRDCVHWKPYAALGGSKVCDVFDWQSEGKDFCSFAEPKETIKK